MYCDFLRLEAEARRLRPRRTLPSEQPRKQARLCSQHPEDKSVLTFTQCDEGHPTCRNCQKSKRECLGYDPIFKPQPGPAPIQPAPANSSTPTSKSTPSSATLPPNTYPHSQSYPGTGGTFVPANNPAQGADSPFEYGAPLDPALAGGDGPLTMAANSYSTTLQPSRRGEP